MGSSQANKIAKNLSKFKNSKNTKSENLMQINIKTIKKFIFLILNIKITINYSR